ncbi:MAG: Flp pilus assembly complex ATPase component TadA [Desulfobacterales bacterium]|nr:Flp pilus assembly complex ATPase component TadA [Desulfobacterales bacterium]
MDATKPLGELLIEQGLITDKQLREALEFQRNSPDQVLGQLLLRLGYIHESDLALLLDQKGKRRHIEDILLKDGMIDQQQIRNAKQLAAQNNSTIEKAFLKLGYLDEESLARAVARQYDLPFIDISSVSLEPSLSAYISPVYARKQIMAPISKIGNALTLALARPLAFHDLRQLESSIGLKIISVIATESVVQKAIKIIYGGDSGHDSHSYVDEINVESVQDSISELLDTTHPDDRPDIEDEVRKVTEKDSVIVKLVSKIVYDAYTRKSSDIHIEPYPGKKDVSVRIRIDGQCAVYQKIPYKYKYAIPSRIKIMADLDIAERRKPQDGKINFKKFGPLDIELRVAAMPTIGGLEDVVIRILGGGEPIKHSQLGLAERNIRIFEKSISSPYGLLLVVGPTGSGKTTTLHSGSVTDKPLYPAKKNLDCRGPCGDKPAEVCDKSR